MKTVKNLLEGVQHVAASTAWYLADIAEAKGKQDLYTSQSPQKLRALREHALIESAVSSNRIEGVEIERKRIGTVIFGHPLLKDRNEEEVRGYRDALDWIHEDASDIPFSAATMKRLHKMTRGEIWDAGEFKERDGDIVERLPGGDTRIRFRTVSATETPSAIDALVAHVGDLLRDGTIHPLVIIAASNLDFLCIHPFRDGNGRVSRLLLLLQLYHAGYEVGRYVSLERLIEENRERYYETLEMSSQGWHAGKHDPWPYVNFLLYILKKAYVTFAERVEEAPTPKGGKTQLVLGAIERFPSEFTLAQLQARCPNVSRELVRKVLRDLHNDGKVESLGRGPGARWRKKG